MSSIAIPKDHIDNTSSSLNATPTPTARNTLGLFEMVTNHGKEANKSSSCNADFTPVSILRKVPVSLIITPVMVTAPSPLYGISFGVFGYKKMWNFSEAVYTINNSSEHWLFDRFDRLQAFYATGTAMAARKPRCYMVHPMFAGLSSILLAMLAFAESSKYQNMLSRKHLLIANGVICCISSLAAKLLINTMMGNRNAQKWTEIQSNLKALYMQLSLLPRLHGNVIVHMNWSLIFCTGILERAYVLCILLLLKIRSRERYVAFYLFTTDENCYSW